MTDDDRDRRIARPAIPANMFTVPGQLINHPDLYSLQLYPENSDRSAPILRLNSSEQMVLRFDMIETRTRQFKISLTHHNPDWSRSALPPEVYSDGFAETFFGGGRPSRSQRPSYRQYEFTFPNSRLSVNQSGNYMLRVEDYETGNLMFSLPFFVYEDEGSITSSINTIMAPRRNLRIHHLPRSRYAYPEFIEMPQFDLEVYFNQNQFWGRMQKADGFDATSPGTVFSEVTRSRSFVGDQEFRVLDIPELTLQTPDILDYQPGYEPPRIIKDVDVQGLTRGFEEIPASRFGRPKAGLDARYGDVYFTFQPKEPISVGQEIYLVGDFNNWSIQSDLKLRYDEDRDQWTVNTWIKEGTYAYKYVLKENGNIFDMALDDTFARTRQEYTTFVYYRDPVRHHYRLLQTNTFYSN